MFNVVVTVPVDVLESIHKNIAQAPTRLGVEVFRAQNIIGQRAMQELKQTPGAPHYPLRWTSERQRRAFFATNGFGRGIPTQRTGALQQGWDYTIDKFSDGGTFRIINDVPYMRFVEGDDTQPFHLDTGWVQAAPILARYQEEAEAAVIAAWFIVSDPFGGVIPP